MIEHRDPITLTPTAIFKWWLKTLKKEKPHLKVTNFFRIRKVVILPKKLDVEVFSVNKDEASYLKEKIFSIDAEIMELEESDFKKWWFTATTDKIFKLKKEIKNIEDRIKTLEKLNPNGTKFLMSYKKFVAITEAYNTKVVKALVNEGASINLGNNLGYIYVLRTPKTDLFSSKNIDWKASKEYKQTLIEAGEIPKDELHPDGKNWFQFFEDSDYLRVAWTKKNGVCKVPNNSVYAFYPTRSEKGIKKELVRANSKNAYLKESYTVVKKSA